MGYSLDNPWMILPLIALVANVSLGFYVLAKNSRDTINRVFALNMAAFALWDFAEVMIRLSADADTALIWSKVKYIGTLAVPFISLHFVYIFPDKHPILERHPNIWPLFYTPLILFYILFALQPEGFIEGIKETYFGLSPDYADLDSLYSVTFLLASVVILRTLYKSYKHSTDNIVHNQVKYVFLGVFITLMYGMVFEFIMPEAGIMAEPPPFSSAFTLVMGSFFAFAIVKYKLMSVNSVIEKSIAYILITLTVVVVFVVMEELAERLFSSLFSSSNSDAAGIVAAIIVAFVMEPIRKRIERTADKIFPETKTFRESQVEECEELFGV